jgi:hypothetical protein
MAKVTREVTQYEVYMVYRAYEVDGSNKLEAVAIFDDKDLAESHIASLKANPNKLAGVKKEDYQIEARWIEVAPTQEVFSTPFNPAPVTKETSAVAVEI